MSFPRPGFYLLRLVCVELVSTKFLLILFLANSAYIYIYIERERERERESRNDVNYLPRILSFIEQVFGQLAMSFVFFDHPNKLRSSQIKHFFSNISLFEFPIVISKIKHSSQQQNIAQLSDSNPVSWASVCVWGAPTLFFEHTFITC